LLANVEDEEGRQEVPQDTHFSHPRPSSSKNKTHMGQERGKKQKEHKQ
jgi:hypothetical protein